MALSHSAADVAERIYAHEARSVTNAGDAIATLRRVCDRLERGLSTVVGEAGFRAMFARSVRKASGAAPILRDLEVGARGLLLDGLCAELQQQEPAAIRGVAVALLESLFNLLSLLIGDDLAFRLFRDTWPDALSGASDSREKS